MKASIIGFLTAAGVAYVAMCAYLFAAQRSLLYFPVGANGDVPADDLRLRSGAETLQIWRRSAGQSRAIIYFGGNAEDVSLNLAQFESLFPDYALYLVNYRGYGESTGSPTEAGLYADALEIYAHVRGKHETVSVIGRSLGSGVATYLAAERPVERLALVTAFDSIESVAQSAYPFVPVSLLLRDRYDSLARAPRIGVPTLILIAERDEFISAHRSRALAERLASREVRVAVIERAGHNTISDFPAYARAMAAFF